MFFLHFSASYNVIMNKLIMYTADNNNTDKTTLIRATSKFWVPSNSQWLILLNVVSLIAPLSPLPKCLHIADLLKKISYWLMISGYIWNEHNFITLHQYLSYNRNTLPQIHWNNLSCSFLPDWIFLCNTTMPESFFEPECFDWVFFTPDLFTFIKTNDVCWVLWNSRKNNKTSLLYVFFSIRTSVQL